MTKPDPKIIADRNALFDRLRELEEARREEGVGTEIGLRLTVPAEWAIFYAWLADHRRDRASGIVQPITPLIGDKPSARYTPHLRQAFLDAIGHDITRQVGDLAKGVHPALYPPDEAPDVPDLTIPTEAIEDAVEALDNSLPEWFDSGLAGIVAEIDKDLVDWLEEDFQIPGQEIPADTNAKLEWILRKARDHQRPPQTPSFH